MKNRTYSKLLLLAVTSFLAVCCGSEHIDSEPINSQPIDQRKIDEWSTCATVGVLEESYLEALICVDSVLKYKPNDANIYYLQGWGLMRLKEYSAAEKSLFRSISLASNEEDKCAPYDFLAEISAYKGDTAAVLKYLGLEFEISNDSILYYTHLTLAYLKMRAFDAAVIAGEKLVRIDTFTPEMTYQYLVIAYLESGDTIASCRCNAERKMLSYEADPYFDELCTGFSY